MKAGVLNSVLMRMFDNRISVFMVFLFAFASFNYWPNWAKNLSNQVLDLQISALHSLGYHDEIDPNVVVVEVDDQAIDEFGRWPWRRSLSAALFGKLESASIVVADIVFSEQSEESEDQILAETFVNNDNVILGFFLRGEEQEQGNQQAYSYIETCALQRVQQLSSFVDLPAVKNAEVNIPLIAKSALSCALFTVTADSDGLYRHYPLLYVYQDLVLPTLALQAFQFHSNRELTALLDSKGVARLQGKNLLIEGENQLLLNFPRQIHRVSASQVLNDSLAADYFDDKIVLVGLSEIGLYDIRPTNLDPYTPGVHIHAAALSNLLQGNWYRQSPGLSLGLTLISILLLTAMTKRFPGHPVRWGLYVCYLALVTVTASYYLHAHHQALDLFEILLFSVLTLAFIEGENFVVVYRQYRSVKSAFSTYVVPEIVDDIVEQGMSTEQKGVLKEVTVLFSDIQDFTQITEELQPEQIITLLNTVFTPVTEQIIHNQGMLDKYIGDEVMAVFNAPIDIPDYQNKSIDAAIGIQTSIQDTNKQLEALGLPPVRLSLGIAAGPVTLGNMGTALRLSYTAVGNTVNLAARMTSLSKIYGQQILITRDLWQNLSDAYKQRFQFIDRVIVKGRSKKTELYGIESVESEPNEYLQTAYIRAFELYGRGDFDQAKKAFSDLVSQYQHQASHCLHLRCMELIEAQPENWNGVYKFGHK